MYVLSRALGPAPHRVQDRSALAMTTAPAQVHWKAMALKSEYKQLPHRQSSFILCSLHTKAKAANESMHLLVQSAPLKGARCCPETEFSEVPSLGQQPDSDSSSSTMIIDAHAVLTQECRMAA